MYAFALDDGIDGGYRAITNRRTENTNSAISQSPQCL